MVYRSIGVGTIDVSTVGLQSAIHGKAGTRIPPPQALIHYLVKHPVTLGTVLVKGSRSARMEKVVEYLIAANESQSQIKFNEGGV